MPEFSVVLRGYNRQQVDALVSQVEGTLGRGPLTGQPINLKRFGWVEFDVAFRGYDRFEVDGTMRRYRRELAEHEGVELHDHEEREDSGLSLLLGDPTGETSQHYSVLTQIRQQHDFSIRLRGYDRGEVDTVIHRIWVTLGRSTGDGPSATLEEPGGAITRQELNRLELSVVARGYDRREVDHALGLYLRELLDLQDGTRRKRPLPS
jgi:DivIVA domain-containing protein